MPILLPLSLSLTLSGVMPLAPTMTKGMALACESMTRKSAPWLLAMTTGPRPTSMAWISPLRRTWRPLEPPSALTKLRSIPFWWSKPWLCAVQATRVSGDGVDRPYLKGMTAALGLAAAAPLACAEAALPAGFAAPLAAGFVLADPAALAAGLALAD